MKRLGMCGCGCGDSGQGNCNDACVGGNGCSISELGSLYDTKVNADSNCGWLRITGTPATGSDGVFELIGTTGGTYNPEELSRVGKDFMFDYRSDAGISVEFELETDGGLDSGVEVSFLNSYFRAKRPLSGDFMIWETGFNAQSNTGSVSGNSIKLRVDSTVGDVLTSVQDTVRGCSERVNMNNKFYVDDVLVSDEVLPMTFYGKECEHRVEVQMRVAATGAFDNLGLTTETTSADIHVL